MAPTIQNLAQNKPIAPKPRAPDVQSDSPQARQISDKKRPKWSPEEDVLIIELRQRGMAWGDISKELPGRSALSCRLHYQNYLERRKQADSSRKCGRKLQRRCPSPGGPLKLCTGNWENKKWRDDLGQFRSHSLNPHQNAHVPFSSLPLRNSTPYPKGTAATQLLSQRWVILRRGIGRGWRDYRRRGFIPIIAVQLGFDTAAFDSNFVNIASHTSMGNVEGRGCFSEPAQFALIHPIPETVSSSLRVRKMVRSFTVTPRLSGKGTISVDGGLKVYRASPTLLRSV
ncbi:predicted protein [Histoplasma mississippiense (nom. inval.)]|uniref:predicted protein n=1 Tax=Ajellomyces capsulatus (strain NAm1 / WU24) TaxID=2059318 RepID=UPI000157BD77|nr:predicted protein [Histoplasma mississippiense (nom. inval.)]EDN06282.1 predicted protein [Histoplasma mississippiense (nom. inval.)]